MFFCEHLNVSGYQGSAGGRYTCRSSNYRREQRWCVWNAVQQQPTQSHARRKQALLGQDEDDNRSPRDQTAHANTPIQTKESPPDFLQFLRVQQQKPSAAQDASATAKNGGS